MITREQILAVCARRLPIRAPAATVSLSPLDDAVRCDATSCSIRLEWQTTEAAAEGEPPVDHFVILSVGAAKGPGLSAERLDALLLGLADALALIPLERMRHFRYQGPASWIDNALLRKSSLVDRASFFEAFVGKLRAHDLALSEEFRASMMSAEEFDAMASAVFPAVSERHELALAAATASDVVDDPTAVASGACVQCSAGLLLCLNFINYEPASASGERMIRDIKQQLVFALGNEHRADRARARAYLEGQIDGISALFEQKSGDESVEFAMPHDLFDGSLVTLKKAKTREDFFNAYCKRRKISATRAE
ncbi:MAG: hypothetical protein U0269_18455 [Polyangiales bacterium]